MMDGPPKGKEQIPVGWTRKEWDAFDRQVQIAIRRQRR